MDNPTAMWEYQLRDLVTGTNGIIGIWLVIMLFLWALTSPRGRWVLLGALLYASSFQVDVLHYTLSTLVPPLQQIRTLSQPLIFALILLVGIALPLTAPLTWRRSLPTGFAFLLLFIFVYDVRQAFSGNVGRAMSGMLVHVAMFAGLGIGLSRNLTNLRDCHVLLRCVSLVGLLFAVGSSIQLLLHPGAILFAGRFEGTLGNAQGAAIFIAPILLMTCYLVAQPTEPRMWRLLMGCTAGWLALLLLWAGSRTGILMAVIAMPLLFRLRLGRGAIAITAFGLALLIATQMMGIQFDSNVARLTSTLDDRTHLWQESWEQFLANPIFGAGMTPKAFHESSYFSAAGVTGLIGLVPLALAVVFIGFSLLRLQKLRQELGQYVMLADLVTAAVVCLGVGSLFEAILLGTLANGILMIFIVLTLLRFVLDPMTPIVAHSDEAEAGTGTVDQQAPSEVVAAYEYSSY